ncbi:MAG TPA: glycosyltransferase family 39 protein [Methylomirabilota bacterium]|nr:glycosyltransferase family 39 protein [Methylomirabilota bacterium]
MPRDAMVRLLRVWAVVALALPAWAALTGAWGPARSIASGDPVLPRPPAAPILTLWVRWQAPPGASAWVVLEPDGGRAAVSDEAYRRRRIRPGWNQLIWDDFSGFPADRAVCLRLIDGAGPLAIAPPVASSWYGLQQLRPMRGLVAALLLGAAAAGALAWPRRAVGGARFRGGRWPRPGAWHLWLGAVALGALVLRAFTLTAQSFWFDEVLTAIGAQSFAWVLYSAQIFGHPPLQYLVAWAAGGAAATEGTVRLPFVAAGVASVVALGFLGRRLIGPATGLLAASVIAVSPYHVELSQLARPYALVVLAVAVSWLALFRALERARAVDWLAFSAAAALAFYIHYLGGMVVIVQAAVAAVWVARRRDGRGAPALLSFAGVAVLLAPWLDVVRPLIGAQLDRGVRAAGALDDFVLHVFLPEQVGPGVAGLFTLGLCLLALWDLRSRPEVALAALLSPTVPFALLWAMNPAHALAGRHFAFVLPMVTLLIAHGLLTAARRIDALVAWRPPLPALPVRRAVPALIAVGLMVATHLPAGAALGGYYRWRQGTDWRTVAEVLDRLVGPDDEVLATLGAVYPLRFYWRPSVVETDTEPLRARFGAGPPKHRVWLVTLDGWDGKPGLQEWLAANTIVVGEVPASWSRQRVYIHAVVRAKPRA